MPPLVLLQVDPNYWLGGPDGCARYSVIFKNGYWEVWDLGVPDLRRWNRLKDRTKALQLIGSWARQPVQLSETVEPPIVFPDAGGPQSERRWGVSGKGAGRKYKSRIPPEVTEQSDLHDLDEPGSDPNPGA